MNTDSGLYLEAMGRHGNPREFPFETAIDRRGNGHGSYWGDDTVSYHLSVKLGVASDHPLPQHNDPSDHVSPDHDLTPPRETPVYSPFGIH